LLLIPVAALAVIWAHAGNKPAGLRFSSETLLSGLKYSWKARASRHLYILRIIALTFIIIALARPMSPVVDSKTETEGIDIVLAIDSSTSMLAEDFVIAGKRQSRVDVVKDVVKEFVKGRVSDRIATVTFAARAYTVCPLTTDYPWLIENLERIKAGMVEDGTAIGSGIAASLNRLKNTKAKSKVIILLTDGRNNVGNISPLVAAEAAAALKVKIYAVGAGSRGPVLYPAKDFWGNKVYQQIEVDLDEETLQKIASITEAKYFRATDTDSLRKIYGEIDKMEKTPIEDKGYLEYNELFYLFLLPGLGLLFLEILLSNTFLRKIP
jgi:Ca-activated chloride channel family protein